MLTPTKDSVSIIRHLSSSDEPLLGTILAECTKDANVATKASYVNFNPERYRLDSTYKVENSVTRDWYNNFTNAFDKKWKATLDAKLRAGEITLADYAKISSEVRHHARISTREHMSDIVGLQAVQERDLKNYGNKDGPTFEWLMDHQRQKQEGEHNKQRPGEEFKFDKDKAYRSIIDSSTKTNFWVNLINQCGLLSLASKANQAFSALLDLVRKPHQDIHNQQMGLIDI